MKMSVTGKTATLSPKEAAAQLIKAAAEIKKLEPLVREAKAVLVPHFESTGTAELDGVGFAVDQREQLDTTKVRALLGDQITKFTKTVTSRTVFVVGTRRK